MKQYGDDIDQILKFIRSRPKNDDGDATPRELVLPADPSVAGYEDIEPILDRIQEVTVVERA